MDPLIRQLLLVVDQAYNVRSWHGANLRGSIRGVTPQQAARRPGPGRHNIHELVLHAAYWKYAAWRRLTGAKRGAFPLAGSNFFERSAVDAAEWKRDVRLLDDMHAQLREAIAATSPARLPTPLGGAGSPVTVQGLVLGIAAHDLYHAGQIQLVKAFAGKAVEK
jgi:hypothetical protein